MENKFKYLSESSIVMWLNNYQPIQQVDLLDYIENQSTFTDEKPCNIYFVTKRPRLSLDPNHFIKNADEVELRYFIHIEDEKQMRILKFKDKTLSQSETIESKYPFNIVTFKNSSGNEINIKLYVLIDEIHRRQSTIDPILDHEVLYVGESYGTDGNRSALDRIQKHETLQKIYSDINFNNPDSEVWIILANFEQSNVTAFNGLIKTRGKARKEDLARTAKFLQDKGALVTEKQKIKFTEAGLINVFMPLYNTKLKGTFPDPDHTSYDSCYQLDVNSLAIELDTRDNRRFLFSEFRNVQSERENGLYRLHKVFEFVDESDRYKMFNYSDFKV